MKLLIVESPSKCKKIASILGAGWRVEASVGHVRDLPRKDLAVSPPDFEPRYEITERGGPVVAKLSKLAHEATDVYLATDPDREGEAISWHLQQALRLRNPLRVTFNEITPAAVRAAVAKPRAIDSALVAAQETRRVLDRLVGYLVSPVVSHRLARSGLSAGRVQSPALRLVVEREREIANFSSKHHYGVRLAFDSNGIVWTADWDFGPLLPKVESPPDTAGTPVQAEAVEEEGEKPERLWLNRDFAEKVSKLRDMTVLSCVEGTSSSSPPAAFTTSTLQQGASVTLGMGPEEAMKAAQALFEQGHITYHRTDNPNLSDEAVTALRAFLESKGLPISPSVRSWKAKQNAQEAHEAIRPSDIAVEEAGETDQQRALYRLIRRRALASQMADAKYATRTVAMEGFPKLEGHKIQFVAKGKTLIHRGWLSLTTKDDTAEEEAEANNPVPQMASGTRITAKAGHLLEKMTQPPGRYSEAGLIKKLEQAGIGRPSTYAAILANLKRHEYVLIQKKRLHPTELGTKIVDALVGNFRFLNLDFTREMEADLDRVAAGESFYLQIVTACHDELQREVARLGAQSMPYISTNAKHPCSCGKGEFRQRTGKSGLFWGCTAYPSCRETRPDEDGKPGAARVSSVPASGPVHPCPLCSAPLRRIKSKTGYFWGCSAFRETSCKGSLKDVDGKPVAARAGGLEQPPGVFPCPECSKPMRLREGRKGYFWGCSGYPDCNRTAENVDGRPADIEPAAA